MIIHIGYHKTGTTYLQRRLFPYLSGLQYYDYQQCRKLLKAVHESTSLDFNAQAVAEKLDKRSNALYSLEALTGTMGVGTYNCEIAQRLKSMGFQKVIITIRRQDKMLESIYRQYIQQGGVLKPTKYLSAPGSFRWTYLNYLKLVKHYHGLFGAENVLLLPQEELQAEPKTALHKIIEFCGASGNENLPEAKKLNKSLSPLAVAQLRVINHFTYNNYRRSHLLWKEFSTQNFRRLYQKILDPYFLRYLSGKHIFHSAVRQKALDRNRESNQELSQLTRTDLKKYGYY